MTTTLARNADLTALASLLRDQHARKVDIVLPMDALRFRFGNLLLGEDLPPMLDADGVTPLGGEYHLTDGFVSDLAEHLQIPVRYLRRMRTDRVDLFDDNTNGWIHGRSDTSEFGGAAPMTNPVLLRAFTGGGGFGQARALLSDRYSFVDHLDVLIAVLSGVRESGVPITVDACDLTERRMIMKISAPAVACLAPELLRGYRSPYSGNTGDENPTVFAGFVVQNSETGDAAFSITPRLVVQICTNGMTLTKDVIRSVHLGSKLDAGIVRWSADTERKNLDLVTARARDAVGTFLDTDYVSAAVARLTETAVTPVTDAAGTVEIIAKKLLFSEEETASVLDHYIRGGQLTAGGILQAVTSFAQTLPDADRSLEMEALGMQALQLAASL